MTQIMEVNQVENAIPDNYNTENAVDNNEVAAVLADLQNGIFNQEQLSKYVRNLFRNEPGISRIQIVNVKKYFEFQQAMSKYTTLLEEAEKLPSSVLKDYLMNIENSESLISQFHIALENAERYRFDFDAVIAILKQIHRAQDNRSE